MAADDYRSDASTAGFLDVGGYLTGRFDAAGDRDWVRVSLTAGRHYQASSFDQGSGSLGWRDAAGNALNVADRDAYLSSTSYFTPSADGTYFLNVGRNPGSYEGTYDLRLDELRDAQGETNGSAGALQVVAANGYPPIYGFNGFFEYAGDVDRYVVDMKKGADYTFVMAPYGYEAYDATDNGLIELRDAGGRLIASATDTRFDGYGEATLSYTAARDERLYLDAESTSRAEGGYNVYATQAFREGGEGGSSLATAFNLGTAAPYAGVNLTTQAGDVDFVKFTVPNGGGLKAEAWTGAVKLDILNAGGVVLGGDADPSDGVRVTLNALRAGTYYARATNTTGEEGGYTLNLDAVPDVGGTFTRFKDLGQVRGSAYADNVNGKGDDDMYRFSLEKAGPVDVDVYGDVHANNTDVYVYNRPAWNSYIASTVDQDDAASGAKTLHFDYLPAGTYFVGLNTPNGKAGYHAIGVRGGEYPSNADPRDDYGAAGTAYQEPARGAVTVGGVAVTGDVQFAGDEDWFRVRLEAGKTYAIDAEGAATGRGTLADPEFALRDAQGDWLAFADGGGTGANARLTHTATATGDVLIAVADHGHADAGTYAVSVRDVSPAAPGAIVGTAGDDTLNGTAGDDVIRGLAGDDKAFGRDGRDRMDGGDGRDRLFGGGGGDLANGGFGDDLLQGDAGNDSLSGQGDRDTVNGGAGADRLFGGGGDDALNGGAGADLLRGDPGRDVLTGGADADQLVGGDGADRFRINADDEAGDTVLDFATGSGGDVIDLSGLFDLYGYASAAGDPLGSGALAIEAAGDDTRLVLDRNTLFGGEGYDPLVLITLQNVAPDDLDRTANLVL